MTGPLRMPDEGHGGVDGEAECRPARNVQREVSAHVDARKADERRDGGDGSAPGRAEAREGSRTQGDRHARVPGQVPEPGGLAAAGAGAADQCRWPRPAYHLLDQLGEGPCARAAREQAARKRTVAGQQRHAGRRGRGTERS